MSSTWRSGIVERDLAGFTGTGYDKGRSVLVQAAWFAASNLLMQQWWFPARWRPWLLRRFGAQVGERVLIRHGVRVHWPWKVTIGHDVWIGENAWFITLEPVTIGNNVCISQGAMICTGSHDMRSPTMEFDNGPITLEDGCWVAANAIVLRGVTVGTGAVVGAGAVASADLPAGTVLVSASHALQPRDKSARQD